MTIEEYRKEIIQMISDMDFDFVESAYWFIRGMLSIKKKGDTENE